MTHLTHELLQCADIPILYCSAKVRIGLTQLRQALRPAAQQLNHLLGIHERAICIDLHLRRLLTCRALLLPLRLLFWLHHDHVTFTDPCVFDGAR